MSDDIEQLRQKYRDIKAPAHLATRIRAEVADRPVRSQNWMPVGATAMAVVIVAWLAPYMGEQPSGPSAISSPVPSKPSLSALAALKPDAPASTSMSLSRIKTVKKPRLPAKPRLKGTKPQTNLDSENDLLKEKHHVLS